MKFVARLRIQLNGRRSRKKLLGTDGQGTEVEPKSASQVNLRVPRQVPKLAPSPIASEGTFILASSGLVLTAVIAVALQAVLSSMDGYIEFPLELFERSSDPVESRVYHIKTEGVAPGGAHALLSTYAFNDFS